MLPCALADGILRTGRLARANWCRGLSAGDARQQLRRDPALPSRASRCLRLAGEEGVVGLLGPPVLLDSAQLPPGLFSAPFSRGRWCGGAGGRVSGTRSAAPDLSDWFFSWLLKNKSKEGKGLQSSDVVQHCPWMLFTIVISGGVGGGGNLFVSVQKGPSVSMSMRTSHSERAEQSALNDLKMVTLDQFLKSRNKQISLIGKIYPGTHVSLPCSPSAIGKRCYSLPVLRTKNLRCDNKPAAPQQFNTK